VSSVPYLPGLDGVRALAVVAVMVYHANSSWLPGGFLGVEVFFVISGYLITLLLVAEQERSGRVDLGRFWIRRARRLLPALFVMMFLVVVYTALFRSDALGQLRGDVIAGLAYVSNWYQIWVGAGYTASGDFAPLRHLWSLAVEEQFYLVWPLVMAALLKMGPRRVARAATWMLAGALAITAAMAVMVPTGRLGACDVTPEAYWTIGERCISKVDTLYLSTITRAGGLLLGAAFALVWRPVAIMRSPLRRRGAVLDLFALLSLVGLGFLVWRVHLVTPDGADLFLFRGGFLVVGVATIFVIAAVTHRKALAGPALGNPVFLWIGTRSYGLYLYHWPIYQMIRKVAGNPLSLTEFVLAMVATAAITEVSYRYVETPIRKGTLGAWWQGLRRSRDPLPRQLVVGGGAIMVVLGLFAGVSLATAPVRQNEIAEALDQAEDATTGLDELLGSGGGDGTGDGTGSEQPGDGGVVTDSSVAGATTPGTVAPGDSVAPGESTVPPTTAAPTTTTTTLPPEPIPFLALGDSVMKGAAPVLTEAGMVVNAEESRQMVDMVPVVQQLQAEGRFGTAVVVHLGTNGPIGTDTLNAFMDALSGVPNVIVLTVKADRGWTAGNNEKIRALAGQRPNVIVLDWEANAAGCPGNCFYNDGIHLRADGQRFYAQLIFDILGIG
jgi:peptidoglycan/LPS O-acetylase OafA/YrhL